MNTLTARLLADLPDTLWPEGVRRLHRLPVLRELANNGEIRQAFVAHAIVQSKRMRPSNGAKGLAPLPESPWQPGPLALAAYGVRHPECQGAPEHWLLGAGRDRLAAAYAFLTASEAPLHPVDDAVPAALALRLRLSATSDWQALAAEAVQNPDRWRLPLQYLWGLWAGDPAGMFVALLAVSPTGAALAAQCLAVNFAPADLVEYVARTGASAPDAHWLAFAEALSALGEGEAARQVLRPRAQAAAKELPPAWNPNEINLSYELERSLLVAATEDFALAQPVLAAAWNQLRSLRANVSAHMGRLALRANDLVVAQTAYQDAFAERPEELSHRLGLARVHIRLGRASEALALLESVQDPAAQVVIAEAQLAAGQPDQAKVTLQRLDTRTITEPAALAQAAKLLEKLDEPELALAHLERAARLDPLDGDCHLAVAKRLLARGADESAAEYAAQATALAPRSTEARETLGRALAGSGHAQQAIAHFQAAVAEDPGCVSAMTGLAEAALAAGQPELAQQTATSLLASLDGAQPAPPDHARVRGQAHTLLGQAFSALDQEAEAFDHFQQASAIMPAAPEPWRAMARHYVRQGEEAQALATLEAGRQALSVLESPEAAPLLSDLAERYETAGRVTEAILALREACAANPKSPAEHRRLGALLRRQGAHTEAVDWLRRALQLRPADGAAHFELACALEKLGQTDAAWSAYQQATLARPAEPQPYLELGRATLAQVAKGNNSASPLQAIAALRSAIERAPDLAEAHGFLAQAQHIAGDPQSALDSYQRALHLSPTRTDWSLGLGQVCLELHRPDVAIAALHDAREHAANDARVHGALAKAYGLSGLWPEARAAAETALRLDPENVAVVRLLADVAAHLGDTPGALRAWQQAVDLAPQDASVLVQFGRCLLDNGREDEARAVFTRALTLAPSDAKVHLDAGAAFLSLNEIDEAYHILAQAVALDPHQAVIQATFGKVAARTERFEAAHAAYLQAAELDSVRSKPQHLREAGEALWSMNRRAAAVAVWQRALGLEPDNDALRSRLGLALLEQNRPAEALELLEQSLRHSPRDAQLAREAARAALAVGQHARSAELLQHAIDLNPGDSEARFMLGQVHEQQGQLPAALNLYRQAARVNGGDGRYPAAAATALAAAGQLGEAVAAMETALKISPDSADVQRQAGDLYLRLGRPADAVHAFEHWASAHPADAAAHLALTRALVTQAESTLQAQRAAVKAAAPEALDSVHARVVSALQQAAALGADPLAVRYWLGRSHAIAGEPREAQRLLESVVAAHSADNPLPLPMADLHRALGVALHRLGQLDRARAALHAALATNDQPASAYIELGLTETAAGDWEAAAHSFRRAAGAAPDSALAHYHLAEHQLAGSDPVEAIPALQRALALQPDVAAWHHQLARLYLTQSEAGHASAAATALGHLQRAVELEPTHPDYTAGLARALARDGDLAAALVNFERATQARPADDVLWTERGQAHLLLHDYLGAANCFQRALELAPANPGALLGAARVNLAQGKLAPAIQMAEAAVRAAPEDAEALLCLADVAVARGDTSAAERHYLSAARHGTRPAPALLSLGRLYARQQSWEKSLAALEKAAAAEPASDEAFAALGEVHAAAGNHLEAAKSFREAARIAPRRAAHLLRLGRACRAQGQLDQAISHLMQARDLSPSDDEILREIGLVFEQRKQFDRALDMYKQAIEAQPKAAVNYLRAGIALKQLKSIPEAVMALERAVALEPKNLEATKQLAVVNAMNLVQNSTRIVMPASTP